MMFTIDLSRQATKFLEDADKILAKRIVQKLEILKTEPICHDSKRIVGTTFFRVRVGDYRVLYKVDYGGKRVIVQMIDKRSRVYG